MKRLIFIILVILAICAEISVEVEARNKAKYKVIGYEYRYIKTKVKVKQKEYIGKFLITYYCPCSQCCGKSNGVTATGVKAKAGRTVAVNPNMIQYGTKLRVGNKEYIAEDTGSLSSNQIDIFVDSHEEALNKGVCYKKVWIIKYKYKKKKVRVKIPIYEKR